MSLVAYGSSDESSEDEGNSCDVENVGKPAEETAVERTDNKLRLPTPKHDALVKEINDNSAETVNINEESEKIHFDKLPKPKSIITEDVIEEDDIPPKKEVELKPEKPTKKDRAPVKITVPSLSTVRALISLLQYPFIVKKINLFY